MSNSENFIPAINQTVKFGRIRSEKMIRDGFTPIHKEYSSVLLPSPPSFVDNGAKASACLSRMFLNNQFGCCVPSKIWHYIGVITGGATNGNPYVADDSMVLRDYQRMGGYIPGNPATDRGCDPEKALYICRESKFLNGMELQGYVSIDGRDQTLIRQVIYLFKALDVNISLPDEWMGAQIPRGNGFVWDVAGPSNPARGHSILAYGYNDVGIMISTWGMTGIITWAAVAKYLVPADQAELFALLSTSLLLLGTMTSPENYNWWTLVGYMNLLGGKIPTPPQPPQPPPIPTPPAPAPAPVPVPPTPKPQPPQRVVELDVNSRVVYAPGMSVTKNRVGRIVIVPNSLISIPLGWNRNPGEVDAAIVVFFDTKTVVAPGYSFRMNGIGRIVITPNSTISLPNGWTGH